MAIKNFGSVRVMHDAPTSEIDMTANNSLSIEFFPPKTPEGAEKLRVVRQALYPLKPQFCSHLWCGRLDPSRHDFNLERNFG